MNLTISLYLLSLCLCIFGIVSKDVEDQEKLNCLEMRKHEWYKGNIEECAAEELLLAKLDGEYVHPDGAFLVRNRFRTPGEYEYDISVKVGDTVIPFYIRHDDDGKYFLWDEKFDFVHDLITYHRTSSASRNKNIYLTDMAEMDQIVLTDDHLGNRNCLETQEWYKGKIERYDAEELLLDGLAGNEVQPDGTFLVRDSDSTPGDYILSVKVDDTVEHLNILRDGAGRYFLWVVKFNCVPELIKYHRTSSVSQDFTIYLKDMKQKRYIALYDFEPEQCDELLLNKGDEITVINDKDQAWWLGRKCRTYQVGYFPRQYVDELKKQN